MSEFPGILNKTLSAFLKPCALKMRPVSSNPFSPLSPPKHDPNFTTQNNAAQTTTTSAAQTITRMVDDGRSPTPGSAGALPAGAATPDAAVGGAATGIAPGCTAAGCAGVGCNCAGCAASGKAVAGAAATTVGGTLAAAFTAPGCCATGCLLWCASHSLNLDSHWLVPCSIALARASSPSAFCTRMSNEESCPCSATCTTVAPLAPISTLLAADCSLRLKNKSQPTCLMPKEI
mmetsp:Transcript_14177/g.34465  ORF Transcript_14177/g.34465 Transcript_14177/m.34465 type:complete len:233 (-) Transcript_14177:38-736(-)